MEALMAIAALCAINGGVSTDAIERKQLACQQELVKCYFSRTAAANVQSYEPTRAARFLHECVISRKIKTVACEENVATQAK